MELRNIQAQIEVANEVYEPKAQPLLAKFFDVFNIPISLPPKRKKEHLIILKNGAELINIRLPVSLCPKIQN